MKHGLRFIKMQMLLLLFIVVFGCLLSPALWGSAVNKYDKEIEHAWRIYMPEYSPQWGWAQYWQESRLNEKAVSPANAIGVAQTLEGTFGDCKKAGFVPYGANPRIARWSILCGAGYLGKQIDFWKSKRPANDRLFLAFCNYNAGGGNCLKAQKLCNGKLLYSEIIKCLPLVTGRHSKETIDYIDYIIKHRRDRYGEL